MIRNAITHVYGSNRVVETLIKPGVYAAKWMLNLHMYPSDETSGSFTLASVGDPESDWPEDAISIGGRFADWIEQSVPSPGDGAPPSPTEMDILFNTALPDEVRLDDALYFLRGSDFSPEIIEVAIQLGTFSKSSDVRKDVWSVLSFSLFEPDLVPALANVLATDGDEDVRLMAVAALRPYIRDPATLRALTLASYSDASPKVRLGARITMLSREEQRALIAETLLDQSLPVTERAAPLLLDPGMASWPEAIGDEFVRAYAEIVASADDVEIKVEGIEFLTNAHADGRQDDGKRRRANPDPYVVDVLLDAMQDEGTRVYYRAAHLLRWLQADSRAGDAIREFDNRN